MFFFWGGLAWAVKFAGTTSVDVGMNPGFGLFGKSIHGGLLYFVVGLDKGNWQEGKSPQPFRISFAAFARFRVFNFALHVSSSII